MKLLVTGADGMLGSMFVRKALEAGYEIRAMVHPSRSGMTISGLDIETVSGDLLDPESVRTCTEGCQSVIHLAAATDVWPARSEKVRAINIDGTKNIIDACMELGTDRLIYVGSASSFRYGSKEIPGDESQPSDSEKYGLDYINSKLTAHKVVLEAVEERGLPAVCVNPTYMFGPYDAKPGSGIMIVQVARGVVPGYAPGGRNYIHSRDVARGILAALEKGKVGESYILGNENLSYKEIFAKIAIALGVKVPTFPFPGFSVKLMGMLYSTLGRISGNQPKLTLPMARVSCDGHYYHARKAIMELGLPQTPVDDAIRDTVRWFRDNGLIL